MQGQYLDIGGRRTYFPPFVNERFGDPPYWACTFASLLNGANVGSLGQIPATVSEIRALAKASGDLDITGGSRSSHMIRAMQVRYGRKMQLESLRPERVKERLASGWAMVGGVTYGALPEIYRRPSPRFKGGHRIVLIGWDDDRTRILDPMQARDHTFCGQWIKWSEFEPAWWSTEQLWFREGMALPPPRVVVVSSFGEGRRWRVRGGSIVAGRSRQDPRKVVRRRQFSHDSGARFDQLVDVFPAQPGAPRMGRFLRVSNGVFEGMLIDVATSGVTADLGKVAAAAPAKGAPVTAAAPAAASAEAARQRGRREEYDRLKGLLDKGDGSFPGFSQPGG
jgi:hypothetical protein